ncbi:MAG TPA: type 2 lanthipeptide synthetase LanM [Acidisarcina sp.]
MAVVGPHDPQLFTRRLAWGGMSRHEALAWLEASRDSGSRDLFWPTISAWIRASDSIGSGDRSVRPRVSFQELWDCIAGPALAELAAMLPSEAAAFYQTRLHEWGTYASVRRDLADNLTRKLSVAGEAVLWNAFNERRTTAQLVIAQLAADPEVGGTPPRIAYSAFLEELRASGLDNLVTRYPVLETKIATLVAQWLQNSSNLLARIYDDLAVLRRTFALSDKATLFSIRFDLSDPHHGGQTVAILCFASLDRTEERKSLVYKPKDLHLDKTFQDLLRRVGAADSKAGQLKSVIVLPMAGYGYMEYVPHQLCRSDAELGSFYSNAGRLAAILYLLGCVDCHSENLIACGDQLILIDAETLLEGVPVEHRKVEDSPSRSGLQRRIDNSILRSGLLPQWIFTGEDRIPMDVSALGVQPPSDQVVLARGWAFLNTDAMIAGDLAVQQQLPTSLPVGFGSPNPFPEFCESFCQGFEGELIKVQANKDCWLEHGGLLSHFQHCTRRFIPRPTWLYHWLYMEQYEPKYLKTVVHQRLLLENLARIYLVSETRPATWPIFGSELEQMEQLDIPFFDQSVSGVDLVLPSGIVVRDFVEVSGYQNARNRICSLSREVIDFEVSLIRGVAAARSLCPSNVAAAGEITSLEGAVSPVLDYLKEAESIADTLVASAISLPDGSAEWISTRAEEDEKRSSYGPIGSTLYSGQLGVALFLFAFACRGTPRSDLYRRLAQAAVAPIIRFTTLASPDALARWWRDQPLGIAGSGGVLLSLVQLGRLDSKYEALESVGIPRLLAALDPQLIRIDEHLDIMLGCAGVVGSLLSIGSTRSYMLAERAGERLIECQQPSGGWRIRSAGPIALTGFSHGASGMVTALAALHAATDRESFAEAAARGLHYERDTFDSQAGNWPDFREPYDPGSLRFGLSWCHGAPGIALSRLCLSRTAVFDSPCTHELERALRTTAMGTEAGDSLCCGQPGRAAILRLAATTRGSKHWLDAASSLESQSIVSGRRRKNYSFRDNVGLFTGASGLALALLESACPTKAGMLSIILSAGLC